MARGQKNKRKKGLLAVITAVILIGGGAAVYGYQTHQAKTEQKNREKVAMAFTKALEKKNFEQLPELISSESAKENGYTTEEVVKKYETIFNGLNINQIKASQIDVKAVDKSTYEVSYQLTMETPLGELKNLEYSAKLISDKVDYKIAWTPALIFPGMEKDDKVSMDNTTALRGRILDKAGQPLAMNQEYEQLGVIPEKLAEGAGKEANINTISQTYGISVADINQKLEQSWVQEDQFVPLKTLYNQPFTEIPGATTSSVVARAYPLKDAAAQLIGYTGSVTQEEIEQNPQLAGGSQVGKTGLEQTLDQDLRGKDGGRIDIVTANGEQKKNLITQKQEDGKDITLTIDSNVQSQAFETLAGQSGSSVVTNPKTGELMALASSPSYDPNKFVLGISQADYDQYANDPKNPFLARFANGYAPGSTFKTITAAIGLDAGITKPDKVREISGLKWQKDASWGSYFVTRVSDVPNVDMAKALIYSDNIYFAQEALEMGEKVYQEGLKKFIFGEKLAIPIAMNPAQYSNEDGFKTEIMLADTAYGQGELLINPIQQAVMYGVFANNGNLVYPKLLATQETKQKADVIKAESAATIKNALVQVVADPNGTAHFLNVPGINLAAKTGTAEIKEKQDEQGLENSFMFAFDADNEKYMVVTAIENYHDGISATKKSKPLIDFLAQQ